MLLTVVAALALAPCAPPQFADGASIQAETGFLLTDAPRTEKALQEWEQQYALTLGWPKAKGAKFYELTIVGPEGKRVMKTKRTTLTLTASGAPRIKVTAFNSDGPGRSLTRSLKSAPISGNRSQLGRLSGSGLDGQTARSFPKGAKPGRKKLAQSRYRMGKVTARGKIQKEVVRRLLRQKRGAFKACGAKKASTDTRKVDLAFRILRSGSLKKVDVTGPKTLRTCVRDVVKSIKFKKSKAATSVNARLLF